MNKVACDNCSGTGYVHAFRHVANGLCFKCNGEGKVKNAGQQSYSFPTPSKEQAKAALGCDYKWEVFHQTYNMTPREALK